MKVMLIAKMERLVASEQDSMSEQVDEISASIIKVEKQIQLLLEKHQSASRSFLKTMDGCLTERSNGQ
jgi:hypothetical protein